jgi:hypothetical protein
MIPEASCRARARKWRAKAKSIRSIPFGVTLKTRVASLVTSYATAAGMADPQRRPQHPAWTARSPENWLKRMLSKVLRSETISPWKKCDARKQGRVRI